MTDQGLGLKAAARVLGFIAMAVSRVWAFMFSRHFRMARSGPWRVLAVPGAPSTRNL